MGKNGNKQSLEICTGSCNASRVGPQDQKELHICPPRINQKQDPYTKQKADSSVSNVAGEPGAYIDESALVILQDEEFKTGMVTGSHQGDIAKII